MTCLHRLTRSSWWRRHIVDDADNLWPITGPDPRTADELAVLYAAADAADGGRRHWDDDFRPGVRVIHEIHGPATVVDESRRYGQVPVRFDGSDAVTFVYPYRLAVKS